MWQPLMPLLSLLTVVVDVVTFHAVAVAVVDEDDATANVVVVAESLLSVMRGSSRFVVSVRHLTVGRMLSRPNVQTQKMMTKL